MPVNYFWDRRDMEAAGRTPTILAVGDSWFWYPMPGGSLVPHIGALVQSKGHVIYARGMNGAEAFDYVQGRHAALVNEALRLYGKTPAANGVEAVVISGGGNDFAGFHDLRPMLKDDCSQEDDAPGCFQDGGNGITAFLGRMDDFYRRLIGIVYTRTSVGCKILLHCYDYANPNGKGVFGNSSWLKPALDHAKVPQALQRECVKHLIDRFRDTLAAIVPTDPKNLFLVDSRGTLDTTEWANELHPTGAGFKKIADEAWGPVLRDAGLA